MNITPTPTRKTSFEATTPISESPPDNSRIHDIFYIVTSNTNTTFEKKISLKEAEQFLAKLGVNKIFYKLNPLNLFQVEVMRTLQQLVKNRDVREVSNLDEISEKFYSIFRTFRMYSGSHDEKDKKSQLQGALQLWNELSSLCLDLKQIILKKNISAAKQPLCKLKEYSDILYHLSTNQNFIDQCSKPLTTEEIAESHSMFYPPTRLKMEFYLDSLKLCSSAITLYQKFIKKELTDPLNKKISDLSKKKAPQQLIESLREYERKITTTLDKLPQDIATLVRTATENSNNEILNNLFDQLASSEALQIIEECFLKIMHPWTLFLKNFPDREKEFFSENSKIQKTLCDKIEAECAVKKNKNIRPILNSLKTICSGNQLSELYSSIILESFRIPSLIIQEVNIFFQSLRPIYCSAINFQKAVLKNNSLPCCSFSALDLFLQHISEFLAKFVERDDRNQFSNAQTLFTALFEMISFFYNVQQNSIIHKKLHLDQSQLFDEGFKNLIIVCDTLKTMLSENSELMIIVKSLIHFYKNLLHKNTSDSLFLKYLIYLILHTPLSNREEITLEDLPWIKKHAALRATFSKFDYLENYLKALKTPLSKYIETLSSTEYCFWKRKLEELQKFTDFWKNFQQSQHFSIEALQECTSKEEALSILHPFRKKNVFLNVTYSDSINLLFIKALQNPALKETVEAGLIAMIYSNVLTFINLAFTDIAIRNPLPPRKQLPRAMPVLQIEGKKDAEEEEPLKAPQKIVPFSEETYKSTPYQENLKLLDYLETTSPSFLSSLESRSSYASRTDMQENLIKNTRLYLQLIEESKKFPLQKRDKINHLLLLELTEKIFFTSLNMSIPMDPSHHISQFLIHTHDGSALTNCLDQNLFQTIQHLVKIQENQLKKAYWYKEDPTQEDITPIAAVCENIWNEIAKTSRTNHFRGVPLLTGKKQKIEIPVGKLTDTCIQNLFEECTNLVKSNKIDPQCREFAKGQIEALRRVFDSAVIWNQTEGNQNPLSFTVRAAEIQVSLLSLLLQLFLSTSKVRSDKVHPLFHTEKESDRPLAFSHSLTRLWKEVKALKGECPDLDRFLPLFKGDPRYPYPGGTQMTDEIITSFELSYLLKKIEDRAFFSEKDHDLFKQHLESSCWQLPIEEQKTLLKRKIEEGIKEQMKKMALAFDLGKKILS